MVPDQSRYNGPLHHGFPYREVIILVLCVSVHAYTLVNVFPYVGVMVMQLMELKSINDAGEEQAREREMSSLVYRSEGKINLFCPSNRPQCLCSCRIVHLTRGKA